MLLYCVLYVLDRVQPEFVRFFNNYLSKSVSKQILYDQYIYVLKNLNHLISMYNIIQYIRVSNNGHTFYYSFTILLRSTYTPIYYIKYFVKKLEISFFHRIVFVSGK